MGREGVRGYSFCIKNKLKSEINKIKNVFSDITKNLDWEILTKDFVLLKNGMWLKMKNFNIVGVHLKIQFLGDVGS